MKEYKYVVVSEETVLEEEREAKVKSLATFKRSMIIKHGKGTTVKKRIIKD